MANDKFKTNYSTLNIEKCFSNHYIVPEYQREYVWETSNVEQLLNDLISAYYRNPDKPYFMGMMVVYGNQSNALELVDGQQRVTTFFLMLCAIAHIYKENADKSGSVLEDKIHNSTFNSSGDAVDSYALELQYAQSSNCLDKIFHQQIPNESEIEKYTASDQKLFSAYQNIKKILKREFPAFTELKTFAVYVFRNVEFVQIETADVSDALNIFETINERGIGLNPMDLLKNMIFMHVNRDRFTDLNKEWKKLIDSLEKIKEKPLRFLRYYISATYDVIDEDTGTVKGILPEDKIYKWLTCNNDQCHYEENPFGFVDGLNKGIKRYTDFLLPNSSDSGNEYLRNIPRISGSTYRLHLVLLLAASSMDTYALGKFKQIIESVLYYAVVCSVKANETERLFAAWCPDIRKIKDIDDLKTFVNKTIKPQVDKWRIDYHQRFNTINLNSIQQYRVRYILSRISKYVDDIRGGGVQYADIDAYYDKKNQIEHIMPQACTDASTYGLTDEDFKSYVGSIGNLSLLERTYNAACQNKSYSEKCAIYPSSAFYLTRSLPALEVAGVNTSANKMNNNLKSWVVWNKQSIEDRTEMLYKLSEMVWSIDSYIDKW